MVEVSSGRGNLMARTLPVEERQSCKTEVLGAKDRCTHCLTQKGENKTGTNGGEENNQELKQTSYKVLPSAFDPSTKGAQKSLIDLTPQFQSEILSAKQGGIGFHCYSLWYDPARV